MWGAASHVGRILKDQLYKSLGYRQWVGCHMVRKCSTQLSLGKKEEREGERQRGRERERERERERGKDRTRGRERERKIKGEIHVCMHVYECVYVSVCSKCISVCSKC